MNWAALNFGVEVSSESSHRGRFVIKEKKSDPFILANAVDNCDLTSSGLD